MEELDEILNKEEELYDDVIEKKDKLRYRHPLFLFLAIIALLAILFFSLDYFISFYMSWKRKKEMMKKWQQTALVIDKNEKNRTATFSAGCETNFFFM